MTPRQQNDAGPGLITRTLKEWRGGDEKALDRLTVEIYSELQRLARRILGSHGENQTIQPTVLVHELYFLLPDVQQIDWESRAHFLNVAAKMMRHVLVDHARARKAAKRGGGSEIVIADPPSADPALRMDVLLIHQALERLNLDYPRQAQVVELRFFGGLTAEETSEVLQASGTEISSRTVERDWRFARAWLMDAIGPA